MLRASRDHYSALPDGSVGASYAAVINTKLGSLPFTGLLVVCRQVVSRAVQRAHSHGLWHANNGGFLDVWVEVEGAGKHKSLVTYSIVISAAATLWQAHLSWQAGSPAAVSYASIAVRSRVARTRKLSQGWPARLYRLDPGWHVLLRGDGVRRYRT